MTDFDLGALMRDVYESTAIADPRSFAKEVDRLTPEDRLGEAYRQALPAYTSNWLTRQRGGHTPAHHPADEQDEGAPRAQVHSGRSGKVRAVREAWRARLHERLKFGPAPSDWKLLGDFTATDLEYAATVNDAMAAANIETAAWRRRLAALLTEHHADKVSALPDTVLADVLS